MYFKDNLTGNKNRMTLDTLLQ